MADNQKSVEELLKELAEAKQLLDQQAETIAAQEATVKALEADPNVLPTLSVDKKTYRILFPSFIYKREGEGEEARQYSAADLQKDAELQKELLAKKVSFLQLVAEPVKAK